MVLGGCEMTRELQRAIQAMAVECDDTYAMANSIEDMLEEIFDDHEAEIKAKDEEIERLKADKECAKDVINWHEKECKQYIKLHHTKARSIVAMLFWEWRKHKRMYELSKFGSYLAITHLNNATLSKLIFQQAYKMLKEQQ